MLLLLSAAGSVLRAQTPPPPQEVKTITLAELNATTEVGQWVSVEAHVWLWRYTAKSLELRLNSRERWSTAIIHVEDAARIPRTLHGAKVRLTGQTVGQRSSYNALHVPSIQHLELLQPGSEGLFDLPAVTVEDVARHRIEWGRRITVRGTLCARHGPADLLISEGGIGLTCNLTMGWTEKFGPTEIAGGTTEIPEMTPGDVVEVTGSLVETGQDGSVLPHELSYCHVRVVGKGKVPVPLPVPVSHLASFKEHSQWVSVEGTVDAWISDGANMSLGLLDPHTRALLTVRDTAKMPFPENLFGARVRLTGMTVASMPGSTYSLAVPSSQHFQVLRPGSKDPFEAPQRPIEDVAGQTVPPVERVKVRGVLIARPLPQVLHVRGEGAAISVKLTHPWNRGSNPSTRYADGGLWPEKLEIGDEVEIVGHPLPEMEDPDYQPHDLVFAIVRVLKDGEGTPAPRQAALDAIISGSFTSDLVETRGRLLSFDQMPVEQGYWRTSLQLESAAGVPFHAVSYSSKPSSGINLRVDDDVLLRAIVGRATSQSPRQLWFGSLAQDVKSLGVSPVVLTRRLWMYGGSGGAVLLMLLAWISQLRRSNQQKTRAAIELKTASDAARESEQRWKLLFEQSPLSVQIFSPDGQTKRFNQAWKNLFRLNDEQGYAFNVLHAPDLNASGAVEHIRKAFQGQVVHVPPVPYPIPGDPPETRWIGGVLYPVRNSAGDIFEVVTIHNDITESKRAAEALMEINHLLEKRVTERTSELQKAQTELQRALEQERELGELKSRFVTMVSHEFRTPLGIIMSAVELLQHYSDRLPEDEKKLQLDQIQSSTKHMGGLMEQVLLLGRAEAGKLTCKPQPLDLIAFAERIIDETHSITTRKCTINLHTEGDLANARVDEALLRHILSNLISNAVKYSPEGCPVTVNLQREGPNISLKIIDHGIGIPEKDRERLFEAFHRCSNVGETPGTGLGLVIVKRCVDLHSGTITVNSAVNEGTTFHVHLPVFV